MVSKNMVHAIKRLPLRFFNHILIVELNITIPFHVVLNVGREYIGWEK